MTRWADIARTVIAEVAATLPDDLPLKERKAAIDAAYPFGSRECWPYKAWLKARRAYLARFDDSPLRNPGPLFPGLPRDPITGRPII